MDSALLMASGLVSHNVIVQLRPRMSEKAKVKVARAGAAPYLWSTGFRYVVTGAGMMGSALAWQLENVALQRVAVTALSNSGYALTRNGFGLMGTSALTQLAPNALIDGIFFGGFEAACG